MNIFHCCVQKTASQWVRRLFQDTRILELSGLQPYDFYQELEKEDPRLSSSYIFTEPFPSNVIITPLYISFESFCSIPKNENYRAFFIMRDPRDLVVSWYFSTKYSHPPIGKIQVHRDKLNQVTIEEGLQLSIDFLKERGYFRTLQSWLNAPIADPNIKLFKYEDLTGPKSFETIQDLFNHCLIPIDSKMLQDVLADECFEKLAKRKQGIEDKFAHYRKGIEGDWINYFDDEVESKFNEVAGKLTAELGYRTTRVELFKKQLVKTQMNLQQAQTQIQQLQQQNLNNHVDAHSHKVAQDSLVTMELCKFRWLISLFNKLKK